MTFVGFLTLLIMDALKGKSSLAELPLNFGIAVIVGVGFGLVVCWKRAHEA